MSRAMPRRTTRALLGLGLGCALALTPGGCSGSSGGGTASSCAAQEVTVSPDSASPGETVVVHGEYYTDGCGDAVEAGAAPSPAVALTDVPLVLTGDDGNEHLVATLDAEGTLGEITYTLTVPQDLAVGPVALRLGDAAPVTLTVTSP